MSVAGSLQLRLYRIGRRDGLALHDAARMAGISAKEAQYTDVDDRRDPPTPECFVIPAGMARAAVGLLADTPIGAAAVARLSGNHQQENRT